MKILEFLTGGVIGALLFGIISAPPAIDFDNDSKKDEIVKYEYSTTIDTTTNEELYNDYEELEEEKVEKTTKKVNKPVKKTARKQNSNQTIERNAGKQVWVTGSGSKYHSHNSCGKTNSRNARLVSLPEAQKRCAPCKKCF